MRISSAFPSKYLKAADLQGIRGQSRHVARRDGDNRRR